MASRAREQWVDVLEEQPSRSDRAEVHSINLENFDEPRHQHAEFVLNSPRSVRACFNVGVTPRELLPRNVTDFQRDGMTLAKAYTAWLAHDRRRQDLLSLARRERKKLVRETTRVGPLPASGKLRHIPVSPAYRRQDQVARCQAQRELNDAEHRRRVLVNAVEREQRRRRVDLRRALNEKLHRLNLDVAARSGAMPTHRHERRVTRQAHAAAVATREHDVWLEQLMAEVDLSHI
ncbi:uncharacterized protein MONBRDRAFT_26796 [Monosiga brevicollis MX1]|uniref:Uncharacterized protein n=1 Tax=Monosiga brevicollis TaxID=81824 RepID=A9V3E2_MONBE|nr:uncharacterized protein MONBRDRAFT_26796 [Monosiga brevicollis MX1]EDQ88173.1 predicted protein [Monosiga brevicollis MX1]|eukprot:XP_001747249.1 hypothetical protein [Monosiga brevicollis MX1]